MLVPCARAGVHHRVCGGFCERGLGGGVGRGQKNCPGGERIAEARMMPYSDGDGS